jgi:hypothetical protein
VWQRRCNYYEIGFSIFQITGLFSLYRLHPDLHVTFRFASTIPTHKLFHKHHQLSQIKSRSLHCFVKCPVLYYAPQLNASTKSTPDNIIPGKYLVNTLNLNLNLYCNSSPPKLTLSSALWRHLHFRKRL